VRRLECEGFAVALNYADNANKAEGVVAAEIKSAELAMLCRPTWNVSSRKKELFDKVITTNLRGTFLMRRQAA
jgi:NAD(P)-dependent dehydrogenase (short-subunit alcohol dehydrogenase family)